jgi:hypothetical protein
MSFASRYCQRWLPTTTAPPLSRTPSTNTITQIRAPNRQPPSRNQFARKRPALVIDRAAHAAPKALSAEEIPGSLGARSPVAPMSSSSSSSPSNSDSDNPAKRSQLFRRPPRFRTQRPRDFGSYDGAIDEGEERDPVTTTTLPFANVALSSHNRSNAKVLSVPGNRSNTKVLSVPNKLGHDSSSRTSRQGNTISNTHAQDHFPSGVETSSSVTSSASEAPRSDLRSPDPRSPKNRAERAKASPLKTALKTRREGSEGTPSMGSSFSDLDGT